MEDVLLDPGVGDGLLEPEAVRGIVDAHMAGRADNSARIWSLLFFEHRGGAGELKGCPNASKRAPPHLAQCIVWTNRC